MSVEGGYLVTGHLKETFLDLMRRGWASCRPIIIEGGDVDDKRICDRCGVMKYHHEGPDFKDHWFERRPEGQQPMTVTLLDQAYAWEMSTMNYKSCLLKVRAYQDSGAGKWGSPNEINHVFQVAAEDAQTALEMLRRGKKLKLILTEE